MPKLKRADLAESYQRVYRCGYCDLQYILSESKNCSKIGYNSGVYGWNWNAYLICSESGKKAVVCTGYRNLTGDNIPHNWIKQTNEEYKQLFPSFKDERFETFQQNKIAELINLMDNQ